jgi:hypothetical protein
MHEQIRWRRVARPHEELILGLTDEHLDACHKPQAADLRFVEQGRNPRRIHRVSNQTLRAKQIKR